MDKNALKFNWIDYQALLFTLLRVAIGWHFFWEGWIKLMNPNWSAVGYLQGSWGPFAPWFQSMANTPWILTLANFFMPWLLLLSGLGLMLGVFSRASILTAMVLLLMFIAAAPAIEYVPVVNNWQSMSFSLQHAQWAGNHMYGSEGSYWLVNKNLIELIALAGLLTLNLKRLYGLDSLLAEREETAPEPQTVSQLGY